MSLIMKAESCPKDTFDILAFVEGINDATKDNRTGNGRNMETGAFISSKTTMQYEKFSLESYIWKKIPQIPAHSHYVRLMNIEH